MIALLLAVTLQCPDGSPPPCGRPVSARTFTIDPNRIAVLPFRVTAADTMLGEGVAELLAAEFTGQRGPLAVHMGTVIRTWRQAGGSARVPLSQADALRAARQMGAGHFVEGSIVGLGSGLTVTASVVSVADGRTRRSEPIRGSADSLDGLLSRLTTTMLALAGAESREGARGVMTASPAAMREYLHGMSAWRRFRTAEASAAFERAFRQDTLFARAAFMRNWIAIWFGQAEMALWSATAWRLRERLTTTDRALLVAQLGDAWPAQRSPQQMYADRLRAVALMPESPEAQFLVGDWLFHYGGPFVPEALERARDYFARSWSLDSQETILSHLLGAGVMLADTPLVRALYPALTAEGSGRSALAWQAAGYLRDEAMLARLRARSPDAAIPSFWDVIGLLPTAVATEFVERSGSPGGPDPVMQVAIPALQGRPGAVRAIMATAPPTRSRDAVIMTLAMLGDLDSATGAAAARRHERETGLTAAEASQRDCHVAMWRAWWGMAAWPDTVSATRNTINCSAMVNLLLAWRAEAPDLGARLEAADSLARWRMQASAFPQGYENHVLARVWESRGNTPQALAAIRIRPNIFFSTPGRARGLREEARLALLVADTATARRALRMYLRYRNDAEPALHAERDSVRELLRRIDR